jgi:tyrosine-protein phosphatase SIW14
MLISPMAAFGLVEKGVFRSNSPGPTDFAFLRTLNLRTVVYLSPERLIKPVLKQFEENGVRFVRPLFCACCVQRTVYLVYITSVVR